MTHNRILIVEDDRQLTSFLERFLGKQDYSVTTAASAAQMWALLEHGSFDLIVLDLGLPDNDGFEITLDIQRRTHVPIIILTARDETFDRIVGLELGADDYVTKPFEPRELLARIKAVLRRTGPSEHTPVPIAASSIHFAGMTLDLVERTLRRDQDDEAIELTGAEFTLLRALAENAGEVLSRSRILDTLYGKTASVTDRAIDAHIARLRRKLKHHSDASPALIRTVHGTGYILAAEVRAT
ncbi:response regulator [Notoacmeibacter ruber]|uniref:response regulator n=1 Tax=Notoacmeibacter ruber TaxID=2670375 RepID=UPI0018F2BB61|nr:response regulator transcription factor [Notoacmeibacter ruber]